jgi:hypothetical protein
VKSARFWNRGLSTSFGMGICEPTLGQVQLTVDPRVGARRHQRQKDANLAHLHLAQTPVVLTVGTRTVVACLLVNALVQNQHRPSLELGMLLDVVLQGSDQCPSRLRRGAHKVLHILLANVGLATDVGHRALGPRPLT